MNKPCSPTLDLCPASEFYSKKLFSYIRASNDIIMAASQSDCSRVYFILSVPTLPDGEFDVLPNDIDNMILYVGKHQNHLRRPLSHVKQSVKCDKDIDLFLNPYCDEHDISHLDVIYDLLKLGQHIGIISLPVCSGVLAFIVESAAIDFLTNCFNSNKGRKIPRIVPRKVVKKMLSLSIDLLRSRVRNFEYDKICYMTTN